MRVLISTVGTRGDVQPAIALALAARDEGHEVRLALPPNFTGWGAELGFPATPVGVEMRAPRPGEPQAAIPDLITDQFEQVGAAAAGCDLIVGGGAHQYAARSIAERAGIAFVPAVYAPVALPSPDHAPPGRAHEVKGPDSNVRLWAEHRAGWNARSPERVNANRRRLGLSPIADVLEHILGEETWLAADAVLGPAPGSPGRRIVQTGAWILADATPLPSELEPFLAAGEPPVYVGFGSMPAAPEASRAPIVAARATGRRVILSRGWAELQRIDGGSDVIAVDDVNHQALFPRVAAVLHHGGAGTTTAAAMAGTPQVVAPMFGDQFYWAGRVRDLGIGSAVASASVDPEALTSALDAALAPVVAERARAAAAQVTPDGAAQAARRLTQAYG